MSYFHSASLSHTHRDFSGDNLDESTSIAAVWESSFFLEDWPPHMEEHPAQHKVSVRRLPLVNVTGTRQARKTKMAKLK